MITKTEYDKYIELGLKIQDAADNVASFFKRFDSRFEDVDKSSGTWEIENDLVYNGPVCFNKKWLFATDEELSEFVNYTIEDKKRRQAILQDEIDFEVKQCGDDKEKLNQKLREMTKEELLMYLGVYNG